MYFLDNTYNMNDDIHSIVSYIHTTSQDTYIYIYTNIEMVQYIHIYIYKRHIIFQTYYHVLYLICMILM